MPLQSQIPSMKMLETSSDGALQTIFTTQWGQNQVSKTSSIYDWRPRVFTDIGSKHQLRTGDIVPISRLRTESAPDKFFFYGIDNLNSTSDGSGILNLNQRKLRDIIAKTIIREIYQREYPSILRKIKARLKEISFRKDDWDELCSKKPSLQSLSRAHNFLENLIETIIDHGYLWKSPFISSDENGNITIEWHQGKRELHIEVSEEVEEFIMVWGTHIEREMRVDLLDEGKYIELWNWLLYD